ncbi:probable galacturonosyltransferase 6 isoform X2 [Dioscorea cayenensis subsp. rotundata]|uniref:Hexosyltransferase n=1 Tax=Dioscorea cayennensis subsp. rotundata TaxID=55577 RepID=A0AB40AZ81_DIOCR|nr:probable galacturonosyltransferase 6 isoform X2 [Dioscorea cayenensis subsp. rotundata]
MFHRQKRSRALILALLCVSVFAPVVFISTKILDFTPSLEKEEFFDDSSGIVRSFSPPKLSADSLKVNSIKEDLGHGLKEPEGFVFKDKDFHNIGSSGNASTVNPPTLDGKLNAGVQNRNGIGRELQKQNGSASVRDRVEGLANESTVEQKNKRQPHPVIDEKVKTMEDMLIMAKAYLHFAPASSNSRLVRELKLRIKEIERVVSQANKDSDLSRSALQKMNAMEVSLSKASKAYPDCSAMASKLRAMTYNTEEQLWAQKGQVSYLTQLAARTFPKGLHCLSMKLTSEYFSLQFEELVVNSTVSTSKEPEKNVFHVVTDSVNFPAMMMWFLLNPPGQATIHIQNFEDLKFLPSDYSSMLKQQGLRDPRFSSPLNHLRFYLPEIFPYLNKILFLDHDVVVQRDLRGLWNLDLKGKVNGAVDICRGESSHRLETLVNFSDPIIAKNFHPKKCIWAFGMNMFDLQAWRRHGLSRVYNKWLQLGKRRQLWKAGSLPLGQLIFYNQTVALGRQWHVLGLGLDSIIGKSEIERASVIHYDGNLKPWLDIAIGKYKSYWTKFLDYDNTYFQQCNIHG